MGHDKGSTHGHSRIFRFAYDQLLYAQMAVRALELWHELERDSGTKLYWQTGMYDFGGNDTAKINRIEKVLETLGTSFEVMDADAMHQRHPQWHPRAD